MTQFSSFIYSPYFLESSKHWLPAEYPVHIWQLSPQLSCGDTCRLRTCFEVCIIYFGWIIFRRILTDLCDVLSRLQVVKLVVWVKWRSFQNVFFIYNFWSTSRQIPKIYSDFFMRSSQTTLVAQRDRADLDISYSTYLFVQYLQIS